VTTGDDIGQVDFLEVGLMPTFCFRPRQSTAGYGHGENVYKQRQTLDALIKPVIVDMGYVCWGIEQLRQGNVSLLRIYIDREPGITLEDCETVSNRVSGILDVEDPIAGEYRLEVSSPGLDRLLFSPTQYEQFIGETVKINLSGTYEQRKRITGRIERVTGDTVILNEAGKELHIPLDEIDKARIVPREY
jgi:ribosome maturation factor RimP